MGQQTDNHDGAGQVEVRTRRWNVSLVWIVPIVAILIGASLVVRNWMQQGPVIAIAFHTGGGAGGPQDPGQVPQRGDW